MHTTRNIFKREKFNMKNTETAFYLDIYHCLLDVMELQLKYFVFFFMHLKDKAFKYLKDQSFFSNFK